MLPSRVLLSRRRVLRGLLATTAWGVTVRLGTGCTPAPSGNADDITMGFIYVGPKDDFGWNQAHYQGKEAAAQIPGIRTVDQENVPETIAVQEAMINMIQEGATVIFPTSFGYFDPHTLKVARDFPDVQFFHAGGLYEAGVHPNNVGSYFAYIDEAQYLAGIVAAHTSKTGKLGFVAAKPIPAVLRNINSYTLGARAIKPDIVTQVIFTGEWSLPVKEAEAANSLISQGADVLTCHVDSPKVVIETAERRGVFCTGYHTDQAQLAPKGYLTGAEWDWSKMYTDYAELIKSGKTLMNGGIPHLIRGGYGDGYIRLSAYGPAVSDAAKQDAEAAKAQLQAGTLTIYQGPLQTNDGKTILAANEQLASTNRRLEEMDWLVEGVEGRTTS